MGRSPLLAALVSASLLLTLAACRPQPETPPGPASPTNPVNARPIGARALALDSDGVIDASIVSDAAPSLDAAVMSIDTGTGAHKP